MKHPCIDTQIMCAYIKISKRFFFRFYSIRFVSCSRWCFLFFHSRCIYCFWLSFVMLLDGVATVAVVAACIHIFTVHDSPLIETHSIWLLIVCRFTIPMCVLEHRKKNEKKKPKEMRNELGWKQTTSHWRVWTRLRPVDRLAVQGTKSSVWNKRKKKE